MLGFLVLNLGLAALLHRHPETPMMRRLVPRRPNQTVPSGAAAPATEPSPGVSAGAAPGPRTAHQRSAYVDSR
ncbi:hypothetical protein ACVCAH_32940 [Micromonospora sp. LZ34]